MSNSKISALTSATTPLAGTEVLPVVQSGVTKQVSVANLTDGRAVSAASLALTTTPLPATSGGTGQSSYAVGDILYANTTTTLAKLADVATGNVLLSGGVGAAPAWGKVDLTAAVTGTLPVGSGGTGTATAFTAGSVVFAGASGVYAQDNANFFWDDTNNRLGVGNAAPACAVDVTGGIQTSRTGVTSPAATDGNIFSGTYTPANGAANTNVSAITYYTSQYMRVGNVVNVSFHVSVTPTAGASTQTIVYLTLPIASNFTQASGRDGAGIVFDYSGSQTGRVWADANNDCMQIVYNASSTTARELAGTFQYIIK